MHEFQIWFVLERFSGEEQTAPFWAIHWPDSFCRPKPQFPQEIIHGFDIRQRCIICVVQYRKGECFPFRKRHGNTQLNECTNVAADKPHITFGTVQPYWTRKSAATHAACLPLQVLGRATDLPITGLSSQPEPEGPAREPDIQLCHPAQSRDYHLFLWLQL